MDCDSYAHRFADIILNSDYELKRELEEVIRSVSFSEAVRRYDEENKERQHTGRKLLQGRQTVINAMFREQLTAKGWQPEFPVFNDPDNDLRIDYWKRKIGVDVAFNHRSFIGGDLLRLQAAGEVKNAIKVGVYVTPRQEFARRVLTRGSSTMANFERAQWYLKNFYPVLTVPILLSGDLSRP